MRRDRAVALGFDPRDGGGDGFIGDGHVVHIGVDQPFRIANQGHMSFPEQKVAAPVVPGGRVVAQLGFLLVAVAGAGDAAGQPNVVRGKLEVTTTLETDTLVNPQELYRKAFDESSSGDYDQAIKDFRRFVKRFPSHNYADNALYWLGETYYSQKKFPMAIIEFKKVSEEYPNGNKVPDAMLKIGLSYANLRDFKNAEDYLQMVLEMYPFSNAARKADLGLKEMKK